MLGLPDDVDRLPVRSRRRAHRHGRACTPRRGSRCSTTSCASGPSGPASRSCRSTRADYDAYVDGKPRADGVRAFLASRGIELPEGDPDDPPDAETVHGLGNRKNELLLGLIARATASRSTRARCATCEAARDAGLRRAVVSSSANSRQVLDAPGSSDLFEVRIDGVVAARASTCAGKPAPDTFLAGGRARSASQPRRRAVFEDALAGVEAGRAGGFGFVVGVDRVGQARRAARARRRRRRRATWPSCWRRA